MSTTTNYHDVSSEVLHTLEEWARLNGIVTSDLKSRFNGISPRDERVIPIILDRTLISCYTERIEAAWAIRLTPGANQYIKCDKRAREFRLKADESFAAKQYQDALLGYTQGLRFASFERTLDSKGNEFVMGYNSRSKLLTHCEQYSLALSDIRMALKYGCPSAELEERRKLCEEKLATERILRDEAAAQVDADEEHEDEVAAALADLNLDQAIAAAPAGAEGGVRMVPPIGNVEVPEDVEPTLGRNNPLIPAMSHKIVEKFDETKGRGLMTTERVRFGEILAKETPYAHTLFIECFDDYCQTCCKPIEGHTVPCPGCTVIQYCSRECKKGDKVHWKYTCHPQLPHIYDPLIQLMIRIVCKSFMPEVRSPPRPNKPQRPRVNPNQPPEPEVIANNYPSFRRLCYPPVAYIDFVLLSVYVGLCVRKMFYSLKHNQGVVIPKLGILIPHIFLHFHRMLVNKVVIISQEEPITITTSQTSIVENGDKIGLAIYNSVAMMNHDCLPNCFLFFYGPKAIIRASRSIEAGEELCICYGPSYASDTFIDRQRKLREWYYFTCECDVCKSKSTAPRICYKCPKCQKPLVVNEDETHSCAQCDIIDAIKECTVTPAVMSDLMILKPGTSIDVANAITDLERGRIKYEKGNYDEAVTILSKAYNTLDDHLYRQNHNLVRARAFLSECLTAMGHHRMAAKLMAVNVNVTGEVYGWESVEYVCIMIPYLGLMYKDIEDIWEDGDGESVKIKGEKIMILLEEQIERIHRLTKLVDPTGDPLTLFAQEMKSLEDIREQSQRIITLAENSPD